METVVTLVLYFTIAGSTMQINRSEQPDLETCKREAHAFMQIGTGHNGTAIKPLHADCKVKTSKKAKQTSALSLKSMT